ncbi:MAG: hypothetical protein AAF718_11450 [Pseudomonadota bacterium]
MRALAFCLAILPCAVVASDRPITAEEFERIVTGHTFTYSTGGAPYGAEEYLSNRRVVWSFLDGECATGKWYPAGEHICFIYDQIESPQCWLFFEDGGKLSAQFAGDVNITNLFETNRQDEPLYCLGPEIGV